MIPIRKALVLVLSLVVLSCAVFLLAHLEPGHRPIIDFVQYWAAAHITWSGGNPYSPDTIGILEHEVWQAGGDPILLWNPPVVIPFILPLAFVSYDLGRVLWLLLSASLVLASWGIQISRVGGRIGLPKPLALLWLLSFFPVLLSLHDGQITPVILFAFSLYLLFRDKGRYLLAGLFLSITLLKPHLLYLLYIYELVEGFRVRRWSLFGGVALGAASMAAAVTFISPNIWSWYQVASSSPPLYWQTPTVGSFLQGYLNIHTLAVRAVPSLLVGLAGLVLFIKKEKVLSGPEKILPISLLSSPYGWIYDQILLLPSGIKILQTGSLVKWAILMLANMLMVILPEGTGQQYYIWYPALIIVLLKTKERAQ